MKKIPISLKVWSDYALFTSPEFKVERLSYPVMTPSAARGVLEAIFWKPQIFYEIDRILVLKPIQQISVRRNEIQGVISRRKPDEIKKDPTNFQPYFVDSAGRNDIQGENRTQRNSIMLRDVAYIIEASMTVRNPNAEDNPKKYQDMFERRCIKGQCFRQPYLGIKECAAFFSKPNGDEQVFDDSRDLGLMLYDMERDLSSDAVIKPLFKEAKFLFAPAKLEKGVLDVTKMRMNLFKKAEA